MFDGGTKVIAVASSIKKKIGPRKGTVAYIGWPHIFGSRVDGGTLPGKWWVFGTTFTASIVRYGFEETVRHEVKSITTIFPYNRSIDKKNVDSMLTGFVEKMEDEKFNKSYCNFLKDSPNPQKDFGLFLPVKDTTNLNTVDKKEFVAWLDSILMNNEFQQALEEACGINKTNIPIETIKYLLNCCYDIDNKRSFFEAMVEESEPGLAYKHMMVKHIRQLHTLKLVRRRTEEFTVNNMDVINGDRQIKERNLVGFTIQKMFSRHFGNDGIILLKSVIDSLGEKEYISTKQKQRGGEILNRVQLIKDHLYKLA